MLKLNADTQGPQVKVRHADWIVYLSACVAVGCSSQSWRGQPQPIQAMLPTTGRGFGEHEAGDGAPRQAGHQDEAGDLGRVVQAIAGEGAVDATTEHQVLAFQPKDGGGPVSLEQLLSLAMANNPAIKELAATTQIAAGHRTQVGLYANPVIGYQGQQLAAAGTDQHLIFLQQQIITGNKRELNRAVLNETVRAQLRELETQQIRVATDIKLAYFECLRIQKQLAAIDQFVGLLQQGVDATEKRMQAGEASKIDLLQAQIQLKQLQLDSRQLTVTLEAKLREIAALTGLPSVSLKHVDGDFPKTPLIQDFAAIEAYLISTSPEYAAAQVRMRESTAALRRQEAQTIPNLLVEFGAGVDNENNSGMMNVQIGAPVPIFNKNQGNIAAARAEYWRAFHEAQRIDNAIRARFAVAAGQYARAAEAVTIYVEELLPAAQETLDLAETAYRSGEQDFVQLLVSRRTYFDTNLAYIAAQAELATAQAQIDGYLLSGALAAVVNRSGDQSLRGLTLDQQ